MIIEILFLIFKGEITCFLVFTKTLEFLIKLFFCRVLEEKVIKNHIKKMSLYINRVK